MKSWLLYIDGSTTATPDELFPDGLPDGRTPTLDDVAELLAKTSLREFLFDWNYGESLELTFRDHDGRLLGWNGGEPRFRETSPRAVTS